MNNIFISYRREDAADVTGRINDRLRQQYGEEFIFTDIDKIPLGVDFRKSIDKEVGQCKILLVIIGRNWLTIKDNKGQQRLFDPGDFVSIEIESALRRDISVIPLLVQGAEMPSTSMLPESLWELSFRNGIPIRPDPDFHNDMNRLINGLDKQFREEQVEEPKRNADTERKTIEEQKIKCQDTIKLDLKDAVAFRKLGIEKYDLRKYKLAITDCDKAIQLNPQDAEAYKNRGVAKIYLRKYYEVITDFDNAIELDPQDAEVYKNRGIAKIYLRKYQAAITDFNKAVELYPQYAMAYQQRGIAKHYQRKYQEAIIEYDKAIELDPEDAEAYKNRGISKLYQRKYQEAISDYDKAIELDPQYAIAYQQRGNAKYYLRKYREAISDYDKAIEINPNFAEIYRSRGITKREIADNKGAESDERKYKKLNK
jgi:tetratricopeptide (TPR) repeat protein